MYLFICDLLFVFLFLEVQVISSRQPWNKQQQQKNVQKQNLNFRLQKHQIIILKGDNAEKKKKKKKW